MDFQLTDEQRQIRKAIKRLCEDYPEDYWQDLDRHDEYPEEFVEELMEGGWLSVLIPEEYGGMGLGTIEAGLILEEINRSGGNAGACHAQMYTMGALLRHGEPEKKEKYLPEIAGGDLRLQSFAITEPDAGSDTTSISTSAQRQDDHYLINGQKIYISRVQHSDLMLLLARTTPKEKVDKKTKGISLFLVDLRTIGDSLEVQPIETMNSHETNQLFFDDMPVPVENLIGEEGKGFYYVLDGMNAERILLASECVGDGKFFVDRAREYSNERIVFDRPIGKNQGVQFPIADAYMKVQSGSLMRYKAATLFDNDRDCGAEANMAKYLCSNASWKAANVAMDTFGGHGMAVQNGIERKFRETRLFQVAPITNNMVLNYIGEHELDMPRSY